MASASFQDLILPVSTGEFTQRYWRRAATLIEGEHDKFDGLLSVEDFYRAAGSAGAHMKSVYHGAEAQQREMYVPGRLAKGLLEAGTSLCLASIDHHVPRVKELALACKREMSYAARVFFNCYYSPPGHGFNMHFDSMDVFIIQLEGEKRWKYGRTPSCVCPPLNMLAEDTARFDEAYPKVTYAKPEASELSETVLTPGDVLYLPPGTWHEARAVDTSFALTLSFDAKPLAKFIADFIVRRMAENDAGRALLPVAPVASEGAETPGEAEVASALERSAAQMSELLQHSQQELMEHWRRTADSDRVM